MFSTWFLLSIAGVVALAVAELTQQYILHTTKTFNARTSAVVTFVVQVLLHFYFFEYFILKHTKGTSKKIISAIFVIIGLYFLSRV